MPVPDKCVMLVPGLTRGDARRAAQRAVAAVRLNAPKLSGISARRIVPVWGEGMMGVGWSDDYVWYQNNGVSPFLMRSLAGKTIPMWIDDPSGVEKLKNPKAKTRTTASGKTQVLIFRRAANYGERKPALKSSGAKTVPKSYPGAPGRVTLREAPRPHTTPGRLAGRIAKGNIGTRWYFPGLFPRRFIEHGIYQTARELSLTGPLKVGYGDSFQNLEQDEG